MSSNNNLNIYDNWFDREMLREKEVRDVMDEAMLEARMRKIGLAPDVILAYKKAFNEDPQKVLRILAVLEAAPKDNPVPAPNPPRKPTLLRDPQVAVTSIPELYCPECMHLMETKLDPDRLRVHFIHHGNNCSRSDTMITRPVGHFTKFI